MRQLQVLHGSEQDDQARVQVVLQRQLRFGRHELMDREKYLARHRKYNTSTKGQKRNQKYEENHPERKLRWEPARDALQRGGTA